VCGYECVCVRVYVRALGGTHIFMTMNPTKSVLHNETTRTRTPIDN
jgi:hypothetical protein